MKQDISILSLEQLKALKEETDILIEIKTEQAILDAYNQVNKIAASTGYLIEDILKIGQETIKQKPRKRVKSRYRNINNTEETWTGRGRQPRWLVLELKKPNVKLEDFLINQKNH